MASILLRLGYLCMLLVAVSCSWDYGDDAKGPENWYKTYPLCESATKDSRQSPIDIKPSQVKYDSRFRNVDYSNYDTEDGDVNFEVKNNGHTVVVSPKFQLGETVFPKVTYQGMNESTGSPYKIVQFHFHWGSNKTVGSEHTINGKHYQIESHFVHMNMKYADFDTAMTKTDGLLVVGNFIEASQDHNNTGYQPLLRDFGKVKNYGEKVTIPSFPLQHLLPDTSKVYSYEGSLTTPKCYRSVRWFVNKDVVKISKWQMSQFLMLMTEEDGKKSPLVNNYRPTQNLYDRDVYTNIEHSSAASHIQLSAISLALVVLTCVLQ